MTFGELRAKLDGMTPDQLAAPAIWWGDERRGEIQRVDVLEEDYVSVGEGMEPLSAYAGEDIAGQIEATMKAGTPILIDAD